MSVLDIVNDIAFTGEKTDMLAKPAKKQPRLLQLRFLEGNVSKNRHTKAEKTPSVTAVMRTTKRITQR
mgnify:CR=1 FL=1